MRIEQLIAELASRGVRVKPLASPGIRFLGFSAVAIASAAIALAVFGPRRHLDHVIGQPDFIAGALLVVAVSSIAVMASLILAVPGAERSSSLRVSAFTLVAVWSTASVAAVLRAGHGVTDASDWYVCFVRVIAIGLVPAWLVFGMLRRAAPLDHRSASALAALGATAIGSAAIQFICPLDVPAHTALGHVVPALVMGAVGLSAAAPPIAARADRLD